jgi:carbonic anhydrase
VPSAQCPAFSSPYTALVIEVIYRIDPNDVTADDPPATAQQARALLQAGNHAFASLLDAERDSDGVARQIIPVSAAALGLGGDRDSGPQHSPFALIVGCADARVPIELILGQGVNDLFVLRVAGNVLGEELRGSIDYAFQHLPSLRIVVVLGHTKCGAMTAAVDAFLDPAAYLGLSADHELRSIVNQLFPAVRLAYTSMHDVWGADATGRPGFAAGLVECSTVVNASLMAAVVRHELISNKLDAIQSLFGVYDLGTRRIGVPGAGDCDDQLLDPPVDSQSFTDLSRQVAAGPIVARHMRQ